jgi:hypothetical protein
MKRFNHFYKLIKEQEEIGDPMGGDNGLQMEPNFDLPAKVVEPLAGQKEQAAPGSLDDKFKSFIEFHVQLRAFHWATESFSQHNGAGLTYEAVDETLDALVESYQGYVGRINLAGQYTILNFADINTDEWLSSIMEKIEEFRKEITYSDVQNLLDELLASVSKFKYLLSLNK